VLFLKEAVFLEYSEFFQTTCRFAIIPIISGQSKNKQKKDFKMKKFYVFLAIFLIIISGTIFADTYTVSNTNDSGTGSLSWAIDQANSNPGSDTIVFSVSGTITIPRYGPDITYITGNETIIDASSQWSGDWPDGSPGIIIKGHDLSDPSTSTYCGINIDGANNCEIRGIHFKNLGYGIRVYGGDYTTIGGTGTGMRNFLAATTAELQLKTMPNIILFAATT